VECEVASGSGPTIPFTVFYMRVPIPEIEETVNVGIMVGPACQRKVWTKLIRVYPAVTYSLDAFKTESMRSTIVLILCSKPENVVLAVAILVFFLCLGAVAYSNSKKGADKAEGQASWRAISTVEEFNKERNASNASYIARSAAFFKL